MKCIYINLDNADQRRTDVEENFRLSASPHWTLTRFPAIDAAEVRARDVGGGIHDSEKACLLSHRAVIEMHRGSREPVMVMEDDARLGSGSCRTIDDLVFCAGDSAWDLIFTDVCIPRPETMVNLIALRRQLLKENRVALLDLRETNFAGSTSYVVNPASIDRIAVLLQAFDSFDLPYDLLLRKLVMENALKAFVIFPFATSLSALSDASQVQPGKAMATDFVWNTFRKMMWQENGQGSHGSREENAERIDRIRTALCDEESLAFGTILAACLAENFRAK